MFRHEICFIKKSGRSNAHERIELVGGVSQQGRRWRLSQDDVVRAIEAGRFNFYVERAGRPVDVVVAVTRGHKYLKTSDDGEQPENLLSLPECP